MCRLCGGPGPLRESHLFPKFIFAWMRRTGSRFLRGTQNPNIRVQDGLKRRLLCDLCEQRFGTDENWFSSNVFNSYIANSTHSFDYQPQLYFFLLSVLWRVLVVEKLDPSFHWYEQLLQVEKSWREALVMRQAPKEYSKIHLFLTDIGLKEGSIPVVNFNRYMARAVDGTVGSNKVRCFMYAKFARFIALAPVTPFDPVLFENTCVDPNGGRMNLPQKMLDGVVGDFLLSRAREMSEMRDERLTERQRQVIDGAMVQDRARLRGSDLEATIFADYSSRVEPIGAQKVGRNERCPCGSSKKYKRCHGA